MPKNSKKGLKSAFFYDTSKTRKKMIKNEQIKKVVKLVLASGYLKNAKPLSLLVVSKAGNGKTEIISSFTQKRAKYITDLSYRGALDLIKDEPNLTHFIIPDFLKITMKKRSTSDNLISLLNALTEDGVGNINMYNFKHDYKNKMIGIIISTTKGSYEQHKRIWETIGFTSRMIICSYDYSEDTIDKILDYINKEEFFKYKREKLTGFKNYVVTSTKEFNKQLNKYASRRFRSLKQLQTLIKCNALINNRKEVKQQDVNEIIELCDFLNLEYKKI